MRLLSIVLLPLFFLSNFAFGNPNSIWKIKVYSVEKGKERFIRIDESNIKKASDRSYEIADSSCLSKVESLIIKLKKAQGIKDGDAIYILCEVFYKSGRVKTLSFQDSVNGNIKIDGVINNGSPALEGQILFCNSQ